MNGEKNTYSKLPASKFLLFTSLLLLFFLAPTLAIDISSCSELNQDYAIYNLTTDIIDSSASVCINITGKHIILDCGYHTIDGTDASSTYGIYIENFDPTNITIKNCALTDWYIGILIVYADNNTIENSVFRSNKYGIDFDYTSNDNVLKNASIYDNDCGLYFARSSKNKIYNSVIKNNNYGIFISLGGLNGANYIFNNFLNNTDNIYFSNSIYNNTWNTTKTPGKNIYGGDYIAGNFWAKPDGSGFSETCTDSDKDGICDYAFDTISESLCVVGVNCTNNTDYLPLSIYKSQMDVFSCAVLDRDYTIYNLTADILDSSASACFNITANHVILDCGGHTIDGTDASSSYGIYIYRSSSTTTNITIKNCEVRDWNKGIYLYHSHSNTLSNITTYSNYYGIRLSWSHSNTLSNITTYSDYYGIYLEGSHSNTLSNITSYSSNYYGIYLYHSNSNTLSNINATDNAGYDIFYRTSSSSYCSATFENVIGTGNKPIVFYNHSVTIKDWNNNVSEIILCNADNSIIDNLTLIGNENNGLILTGGTENTTIKNSYFRDLEDGIFLYYSNSNTLTNITAYSDYYGIYLYWSHSNTLTNITTYNNNQGIRFWGSNSNTLSNITTYSNYYGIYLNWYSDSNTINNSRIYNNSQYGIYSAGENGKNLIYNNFLNNSNNVGFGGTIYANSWNTTKQEGENIYNSSNPYIGGNFYTKPDGTGYSETCSDTDKDGFCNSPYDVITDSACTAGVDCSNNTDFLPLSDEYSAGAVSFSITLNSPSDGASTTDQTPDFTFTVSGTESSYSCDLFIDSKGYGTTTASNNTPTVITANHSLSEGSHNWYIECSAGGVTDQSETRTLTVTSAASGSFQIILQKSNSFEILYYNETQKVVAKVFTTTGICEATANLPKNIFSKISFSCCSDNLLKMYVNSELVNQTPCTGSIVSSTTPLYIGGNESGYSFKGIIDEVHILNTSKNYDPTRFYKLTTIIYNPLTTTIEGLYIIAKISGKTYEEYKNITIQPSSFFIANIFVPKGIINLLEITPKSCPLSVSLTNAGKCE